MANVLHIASNYFSDNNIRYVFIDGILCENLEQCYDTLQEQLSLPDYFGRNLDALDEVLSDLEWIEEEKIKIIILNSEKVLINDLKKKKVFLDILDKSDNEKLEIIYAGKNHRAI